MKTYLGRSLLGALTITPLLLAAAPAHAEEIPTPERRYAVADDNTCWTTPDAHSGSTSSVRIQVGELLNASNSQYSGTGLGGGDQRFRFVRPEGSTAGCYVPSGWLSDDVGSNWDHDAFNVPVVVDPDEQATAVGGVLARNDLVVYAAPTFSAEEIMEVERGDVLMTWGDAKPIAGGSTLVGQQKFVPVHIGAVSIGFILSDSVRVIPPVDPATLSTEVVLDRGVVLHEYPSEGADVVGEPTSGTTLLVGDSYAGWLPVVEPGNDDVKWLREADLLADPEPTETASPTAEPTDPSLIEQGEEWLNGKKEQVDAKIAEVKEEKARAIALARLRLAGLIALGAVALALVGHTMSSRMRRGFGQIASDLAAGGPVGLIKHLTIPAAMVGAAVAARLAPTSHFLVWTLAASAGVGLLVGGAAAVRTGFYADRDIRHLDPKRWQYVAIAALAGMPALHYLAAVSWPAAIAASLMGAGVLAGVLGPKATVMPTIQPEAEHEKDAA